jgi:hypothetical protein
MWPSEVHFVFTKVFIFQVNQSRVLGVEFDQATGCETFYDRERQPLLTVTVNHTGLPQSWVPANGGQPVNITYDRWGKLFYKSLLLWDSLYHCFNTMIMFETYQNWYQENINSCSK